MAIEHSTLTGSQLHEPKGCATATAGTVYVADGAGSGDWESPISEIHNPNIHALQTTMTDVSMPSSVYFNVPVRSTLTRLSAILYGTIDANTVLTIYIGGVLFAENLSLVAAGSSAGQKQSETIGTANTIPAGTIVTITSDGAATTTVRADIQLELEAIA